MENAPLKRTRKHTLVYRGRTMKENPCLIWTKFIDAYVLGLAIREDAK